ncbi:unnamed protein product, partial [Sphagnum compactum]
RKCKPSTTSTTTTSTTTTQIPSVTLPTSQFSTIGLTPTTASFTSTTQSSINAAKNSCLETYTIDLVNPNEISDSNQFEVNATKGDIIITIISTRLTSAIFLANRINELKLIRDNVTIGVRSIIIANASLAKNVLEKEVKYLKDCIRYPIGIFIAQELWHLVKPSVREIGYNIWPIPSLNRLKQATIARLFYELPWFQKNISIEIISTDDQLKQEFLQVARTEKICLNNEQQLNNGSTQPNLRILLGQAAVFKNPNKNDDNYSTTVAVSFKPNRNFITLLPSTAYIITESELDLKLFVLNKTENVTSESNVRIVPTDFMAIGSLLLEVSQWLNDSINSHCLNRNKHLGLGACSTITQDTPQITYAYLNAINDMTRILKMSSIVLSLNVELIEKKVRNTVTELKPVAVINLANNVTTVYRATARYRNGTIMNHQKLGQILSCTVLNFTKPKDKGPMDGFEKEFLKMFWHIRSDAWVAAGLTIATLGIVVCLSILTFLFTRICIQDVLEGNPTCSVLLLFALILQFASFIPFSIEYTGYHQDMENSLDTFSKWNTHCSVKIFVVSLTYCLTFSLLLCRAVMLASIGSEGGFLSHVNGYIQSLICFFSTLVQIGLSTQLVVLMNTLNKEITCNDIYYGHWFWGIVGYDGFLLLMLILLAPFVIKSQRNYKEGLLLVIGSVLCLFVWSIWVPLCLLSNSYREAAIPLGAQATALAILGGILVPRSILIVKSIARSDLVQALPSLTSLAFAQAANQYASEQSMYDCVNPAMRNHLTRDEHTFVDSDLEDHPSPSQVPTLPLRTNRNFSNINHYYRYSNGHAPLDYNTDDSLRLNLPPSPDKMTRF